MRSTTTSFSSKAATKSTARATVRSLGLILNTLFWIGPYLAACLVVIRPARANFRIRQFILRAWSRGTLKLIGCQVRAIGSRPSGQFQLVSNHLSYIDMIVYWSMIDVAFVSKSEVRSWPGIGHLARLIGTVFIDRTRKKDLKRGLDALDLAFKKGQNIAFFPEGTSSNGQGVLPFKPGLFEWAVRNNFSVHFSHIRYELNGPDGTAETEICWWGNMTFLDHVFNLLRHPEFTAIVSFGPDSIFRSNRKALASALHQGVLAYARQ